jgi:hypothetical protein
MTPVANLPLNDTGGKIWLSVLSLQTASSTYELVK